MALSVKCLNLNCSSEGVDNPQELFTSILFHLNQCGLEIKVDHQIVDKFVNNLNKTNYNNSINFELSKKELKFLEKNLQSLEEKYNYSI